MTYKEFVLAQQMCGHPATVEGVPPLTLPKAMSKPLKSLNLLGNSVRTITIDGVEYEIPSGYALLDNSGSTATAYYCKRDSDSATGTLNLTTGVFTASTFTAGNELPTPSQILGVKGVGDKTENLFDKSETKIITASQLLAITKPTYASLNVTAWNTAAKIGNPATWNSTCNALAIPTSFGNSYSVKYFGTITNARPFCGELDSNGNILCTQYAWTNGGTVTPTMSDCAYLCIEWSLDSTDNSQIVIVEGSTAPSSYIPYGYKFPVLHAQNCGMVDLGTFYTKLSYNADYHVLYTHEPLSPAGIPHSVNIYCSKYKATQNSSYDREDKTIHIRTDGGFDIRDTSFDNATDFKNSLKGLYFYYQRTTDDTWVTPEIKTAYRERQFNRLYNGGMVDLGDYFSTFNYDVENHILYLDSPLVPAGIASSLNIYCSRYASTNSTSYQNRADKTIRIRPSGGVDIKDTSFDNSRSFKESLKGLYFYYRRTTDTSWSAPIFDQLGIVSGADKVRIAKKVFDGTENWNALSGYENCFFLRELIDAPTTRPGFICTHYSFKNNAHSGDGDAIGWTYTPPNMFCVKDTNQSDATSFKAYLAAQYAAGTPVTVWYPLAEEVAESGTPVAIKTASGTNYLDIETDVKPSNLSAKYIKK